MKNFCNKVREHKNNLLILLVSIVGGLCICSPLYRAMTEQYSMDSPKETHYYDLEYQIGGEETMRYLCTELAAEGECTFAPDERYYIYFHLPPDIAEGLAAGRTDYQVDVAYTPIARPDSTGYIQVKVYDPDSGELYVGGSGFAADETLHLTHYVPFVLPDGEGWFYDQKSLSDKTTPESLCFKLVAADHVLLPKTTTFTDDYASWQLSGSLGKKL